MDIETLRIFNHIFAGLGPIWLIGPLMRRGLRYWYLLIAIFLLFAYSNYCVYASHFGTDGALLRTLTFASLIMVFGYVWAVTMNKYEASKKAEATSADAS